MNIAFTGHRDYDSGVVQSSLDKRLEELAREDEVTFFSGMAVGFDLAAAEAVILLRERYRHVKLMCIVPFEDQSRFFSDQDLTRYNRVLECADQVVVLEREYSRLVYLRRNDYLVESADLLIAYYDRSGRGGTAYTVRKAKKAKVAVENLYPNLQLSLF